MKDNLQKMGDDIQNWEKMEDDPKQMKNGRRPQAQLNKSTLIGCDIIVN